jgi:hypothetical protein
METLAKIAGYGLLSDNLRGNDKVFHVLRSTLHYDEGALEGIKSYRRERPTLHLLYQALLKYDRRLPNYVYNENFELAFQYVKRLFQPTEKLKIHHPDTVEQHLFPSGSNAGYPYALQGLRSKAEAWGKAKHDAVEMYYRLISGMSCTFPPSLMFPRALVCARENPKTRPIWGKSLKTLILEAMFTQSMWEHQKSGNTPAAYDFTPFHGGYAKLASKFVPSRQFGMRMICNLDFKSFDTSTAPWFTRRVYEAFKDFYDWESFSDGRPIPKGISIVYSRLIKDHIHTKILMPDGYLYQKHIGDDTGSHFFQLVQNFKTAVLCVFSVLEQGFKLHELCGIKVLGDDSIFGIDSSVSYDLVKANSTFQQYFGLELSIDKCNLTRSVEKITFLGRNLLGIQSARNLVDIVLAALYPERTDTSDLELAMRIVALYYENAGGNTQADWFLKRCWEEIPVSFRELLSEYKGNEIPWPKRWRMTFKLLGLTGVPQCRLPSDSELYHLIHGKYRSFTYSADLFRPYMYNFSFWHREIVGDRGIT